MPWATNLNGEGKVFRREESQIAGVHEIKFNSNKHEADRVALLDVELKRLEILNSMWGIQPPIYDYQGRKGTCGRHMIV